MAKVRLANDGTALFECPGCDRAHGVRVRGEQHPVWGWNGSVDAPTFTPSIRVTYPANLNAIEEFKEWSTERCCHSFVTDGKIQFLGDCTHAMAGQTVDIPDWDES